MTSAAAKNKTYLMCTTQIRSISNHIQLSFIWLTEKNRLLSNNTTTVTLDTETEQKFIATAYKP